MYKSIEMKSWVVLYHFKYEMVIENIVVKMKEISKRMNLIMEEPFYLQIDNNFSVKKCVELFK
jgi:hypothetical protein